MRRNRNRMFAAGLVLLGILAAAAVIVPLASPYSATQMSAAVRNQGSSWVHPFGTDKFGRDLLVRCFEGVRISLLVGAGSAVLNGILGILLGGLAGYAGKVADQIVMRAADILSAIPSLLYVILIMLVLGSDVRSILLGLCISGWVDTARLVRGEILRLKTREFVEAARLAGAGNGRIFLRHLLPNAAGPVIVNLTFLIPQAIFTEAFLSFVGVGIPVPAASLGTLIQSARSQMQVYPYQLLIPTAVLCLLILSVNLTGMGMENRMRNKKERV